MEAAEKTRLINYAMLMAHAYRGSRPLPFNWAPVRTIRIPLIGFNAGVYMEGDTDEVVVAIRGVEAWLPIDLAGSIVRRARVWWRNTAPKLGIKLRHDPSYSDRIVTEIIDAYFDFLGIDGGTFTIIGHSGGAGIASWLGYIFERPTVTFNGGRTHASLLNDGSKQTNVIVRGDKWGDPIDGRYAMALPGKNVWLEATKRKHYMGTIIEALRAL